MLREQLRQFGGDGASIGLAQRAGSAAPAARCDDDMNPPSACTPEIEHMFET